MEMQSLEGFFTAQQSAAKTTFHRGLNLKKTAGLKREMCGSWQVERLPGICKCLRIVQLSNN